MHKILSSEKLHCRPIRAVHEDFILFDPLEECNFRKWKLLLNWKLTAKKRASIVGIPLFLANSIVFAVGNALHLIWKIMEILSNWTSTILPPFSWNKWLDIEMYRVRQPNLEFGMTCYSLWISKLGCHTL